MLLLVELYVQSSLLLRNEKIKGLRVVPGLAMLMLSYSFKVPPSSRGQRNTVALYVRVYV